MSELNKIALKILENGKGILAADESTGTMTKRLEGVKVESTIENRIKFRETLFSAKGMSECIGGVILYDETIKQKTNSGKEVPKLLSEMGSIAGIKVDTGAKQLAGSPNEKITEGLDGLRDRLKEYSNLGAQFTKWRGVYNISKEYPSKLSIHSNAHALARYAAICQEQGLVPIIEPEVLMDGNHDSQTCFEITARILDATFAECEVQGVHIPGALLKPNMILPGKSYQDQGTREKAAQMTVDCLTEHVPHELPGIVFLSGGQSDEDATAHLNLMNGMAVEHPWQLSYSYGRALLAHALQTWASGSNEESQNAFAHRAAMNSLARSGDWSDELEA